MPRREFASEKALRDHAVQIGEFWAFEHSPTYVKWQRLLSPEEYEIVDVLTSRGVRRAILFPKAVLKRRAALGSLRETLTKK
jgi:hypothetical protein